MHKITKICPWCEEIHNNWINIVLPYNNIFIAKFSTDYYIIDNSDNEFVW